MEEFLEIELHAINEIDEVAKIVLEFAADNRVYLFKGEMGAGKTTFIKAICKSLGSASHFSSPTYSIVNEYEYPKGKIYHFDLYRLKSIEELFDIGIEEYLNSGNYCLFEWPDLVSDLIAEPFIEIEIMVQDAFRTITCRIKRE